MPLGMPLICYHKKILSSIIRKNILVQQQVANLLSQCDPTNALSKLASIITSEICTCNANRNCPLEYYKLVKHKRYF